MQAPASPAKPSPTVVTIENALSMLTSPTIVQADIHDASPTTLIDRDGRLYTVDEHNPADRAKVQQAAFARHERDRTFTLFVE
ncbi:MAG: hypothetical protein IPL39_23865 [Opitutaceae bacterium]|nr:hypothetical protein [Opitutaceae bacterium]